MLYNRYDTPLLGALSEFAARDSVRAHMPGHKGILPDIFSAAIDFTEIPGLGDLRAPTPDSPIFLAEQALGDACGKPAIFLTGGSSQGNFAMISAYCRGKKLRIINPEDTHISVFNACEILGVEISDDADTAFVTSPTYEGVFVQPDGDYKLLLQDAAHGAHLILTHRMDDQVARATAMVSSAHKTLPALGQAAFLLGNDIDKLRAEAARLGTTSPSYLIMASIDHARCFAQSGDFGELFAAGASLRPAPNDDPLRWVYRVKDGAAFADYLRQNGVEPERVTEHSVILLFSLADDIKTLRFCHNIAMKGVER